MTKPVAKGFCVQCDEDFIIWYPNKMSICMYPKPKLPTIASQCPICGIAIVHETSYKDVWIFNEKGVPIVHSYDNNKDIQPITEEEIENIMGIETLTDLFGNGS